MPKNQSERSGDFIKKAKKKYGELYDYSRVEYLNQNIHVAIVCSKHGVFYTSPKSYLAATRKVGCPYCSREKRRVLLAKSTTKEVKSCETNNFNVIGGTKKNKELLLNVFK